MNFYTADLHFGHNRCATEFRGFSDVGHHDLTLQNNWRSVVSQDDVVYVLGDLSVSSPDAALEKIKHLPGRKHFVAGNHDKVHPMHREAHKYQPKFLEAFESVQPYMRRKVDGVEFLLSHFPYHTDHTSSARYTQWRLRDEGMWLVHGHTHSTEQFSGKEIHVGVDAWGFAPVPEQVIVNYIKTHITT